MVYIDSIKNIFIFEFLNLFVIENEICLKVNTQKLSKIFKSKNRQKF